MELTTLQKGSPARGKRRHNTNTIDLDRGKRAFPIIVHSHLSWDWVWQRPQQFHSRLSQQHPVLFVEGPRPNEQITEAKLTLREVAAFPNIIVVQMEVPASRWQDGEWVDNERRRQLKSVLAGPVGQRFANPVQWFYDPMAVTAFAGQMDEAAIVYDCMDELSQFRGAPPELVRRERELLSVADVVFGGGPKLAQAKRKYHKNVYSYGCGVDVNHFAKARLARTKVPDDIAHLTGPTLGYFGVVDERMDYELIAALADHDANWNIVIVGPWTKVDRAAFPQRANLHWLGGRDYARLPAYVKKFDVCLMPFAINEATEFINPTKALEYMASGRPIVSTAVEDVVLQFDHVVEIAGSRGEFIRACEKAVSARDGARIRAGLKLARQNTWDSIVAQLEKHVNDVLTVESTVATSAA